MAFCCRITSFSLFVYFFFFYKRKTAYELRFSVWSSDVCSSDLLEVALDDGVVGDGPARLGRERVVELPARHRLLEPRLHLFGQSEAAPALAQRHDEADGLVRGRGVAGVSGEETLEARPVMHQVMRQLHLGGAGRSVRQRPHERDEVLVDTGGGSGGIGREPDGT